MVIGRLNYAGWVAPEHLIADVSTKLLALRREVDGGLDAFFPGHEPAVADRTKETAMIDDGSDGDVGLAITLADDELYG